MAMLKIYILFAVICLSYGQMQLKVNGAPRSQAAQYDVPSGADLEFTCMTSDQQPTCEAPTPVYAKYQRFMDGVASASRLSLSTTTNSCILTLSDVKYYDTGFLKCNDDSVYIFVNDPDELLYPVDESYTAVYFRKNEPFLIPCHPTHSDVVPSLSNMGGNTYDPTIGFTFPPPTRNPVTPTNCIAKKDGRQSFELFHLIPGLPLNVAMPTVRSLNSTTHYIAGTTLQLECSVQVQHALLRWNFPSKGDVQDERVNITTLRRGNNIVSTLTIKQINSNDNGTYICVHGGDEVSEEKNIFITVYEKAFLQLSTDQNAVEYGRLYNDAMFHVSIIGYPPPKISWSKDGGSTIRSDDKYNFIDITTFRDTTEFMTRLTITMLKPEDAGEYTVTANNGEFDEMKFTLTVQDVPSHIVTLLYDGQSVDRNNFFKPDKMLKMTCQITGGVPDKISWEYQNCSGQCPLTDSWTPVAQNDPPTGVHISEDGPNKQAISVKLKSSGWFKCVTVNAVATFETEIRVNVSEVAGGLGFPDDISDITDNLVEDYSASLPCYSFKFDCNVTQMKILEKSPEQDGSLVLRNTYTRDSPEIDVVSLVNSDVLKLKFDSISLDMNGYDYTCECNMLQGSTTQFSVSKSLGPSFAFASSGEKTVDEGDTEMFACVPSGRPLPTVTWFWNDEKINNNDQLVQDKRYKLSDNNHNLTIDRAKVEESGTYKCVASTDKKNITSSFELTVVETGLAGWHIALIVIIIIIVCVVIGVVTIILTRKYCRKRYIPSGLLLPSKDMINPDIPLDEQTDALPYDVGWEFPYNKLKIGQLLGQGAFGRVLKAEAFGIEEGVAVTTVAVKTTRDNTDIEQVKALISELKILIHIGQHLNVVNLLGACTKNMNKGMLMVIVEYCRYGNLRAYLLKHKSHFNPTLEETSNPHKFSVQITGGTDMQDDYLNEGPSELHNEERPVSLRDLICWSYQIARGMEYLSSIDYIHRDLAARNVLLADDNLVKICDFGLAKDIYKYQEYQKKTDGPLPIKWMALESLTHKVFNTTTDVWSYGVTLWELFSLAATPYPGVELDETFIDKLEAGYRMDQPKSAPGDIYTIMLQTWHPDPDKRPTFQELSDILSEMLSEQDLKHLTGLEDPYIRTRDSRADITIRQPSGRRRRLSEFDSNYIRTSRLRKSNGAPGDYLNTMERNRPTTSQPNQPQNWDKTDGTADEKLPLQVAIEDDSDMPTNVAPCPSPWERQSHLGKVALRAEDTHSTHSAESDGHRPPSYNYVMKKKDDITPHSSNLRVDLDNEEGDDENQPFIETSC